MQSLGYSKLVRYFSFSKTKLLIIVNILCLLSIIASLSSNKIEDNYQMIFLLPMGHLIVANAFIFFDSKRSCNLIIVVVHALYLLRNVITPLFMGLEGCETIINNITEQEINYAIIYMIYETIFVFAYMHLFMKGPRISTNESILVERRAISARENNMYGFVMFFILLVFIYGYMSISQLKDSYYSIFDTHKYFSSDRISADLEGNFSGAGSTRNLYILSKYIQKFLMVMISLWVIERSFNKASKNFHKQNRYVLISIMTIPFQFLFMSDANLASFIISLCLILVILGLYPQKEKKLIRIFFVLIAIAGIGIFAFRFTSSVSNYSQMSTATLLNAYIPGISNFAGMFHIAPGNMAQTLFDDITYMIPFHSTIFGTSVDNRLVTLYCAGNSVRGQIIPCAAQGQYYLTWVLGPMVSVVFVSLAQRFYYKMKNSSSVLDMGINAMLFVYAIITPTMYNFTIFLANFYGRILPIILIKFTRRIIWKYTEKRINLSQGDIYYGKN